MFEDGWRGGVHGEYGEDGAHDTRLMLGDGDGDDDGDETFEDRDEIDLNQTWDLSGTVSKGWLNETTRREAQLAAKAWSKQLDELERHENTEGGEEKEPDIDKNTENSHKNVTKEHEIVELDGGSSGDSRIGKVNAHDATNNNESILGSGFLQNFTVDIRNGLFESDLHLFDDKLDYSSGDEEETITTTLIRRENNEDWGFQLYAQPGPFLGLHVKSQNEVAIRNIVLDGPAHKAGLKSGDVLTFIHDENIEGWTVFDVVERLDQYDTQVQLYVTRRRILSAEQRSLPNTPIRQMEGKEPTEKTSPRSLPSESPRRKLSPRRKKQLKRSPIRPPSITSKKDRTGFGVRSATPLPSRDMISNNSLLPSDSASELSDSSNGDENDEDRPLNEADIMFHAYSHSNHENKQEDLDLDHGNQDDATEVYQEILLQKDDSEATLYNSDYHKGHSMTDDERNHHFEFLELQGKSQSMPKLHEAFESNKMFHRTDTTPTSRTYSNPMIRKEWRKTRQRKSLARSLFQLDKVDLPAKRKSERKGNRSWKHFLGLDALPTLWKELKNPSPPPKHQQPKFNDTQTGKIRSELSKQSKRLNETLKPRYSVTLRRSPTQGLGLKVLSCGRTPYLRISEIIPGGVAEENGMIRIGDNLISVNGRDMNGVGHEDAIDELKRSDITQLVLKRDSSALVPLSRGRIYPSRIPVPIRPPLAQQLHRLEAHLTGRCLVLGNMNDIEDSVEIREEYDRLNRHTGALRCLLEQYETVRQQQIHQQDYLELLHDQLREVHKHAMARAAKEQEAMVAAVKMVQAKLDKTLEERAQEKEAQSIVSEDLQKRIQASERAVSEKESDLVEALKENRRLAQALRQLGRVSAKGDTNEKDNVLDDVLENTIVLPFD
eukprot:m.17483 g.17483  ORF g.17483 m.17483 type:complete len:888 (-) comp6035_c0_seq1:104-2767(-)